VHSSWSVCVGEWKNGEQDLDGRRNGEKCYCFYIFLMVSVNFGGMGTLGKGLGGYAHSNSLSLEELDARGIKSHIPKTPKQKLSMLN